MVSLQYQANSVVESLDVIRCGESVATGLAFMIGSQCDCFSALDGSGMNDDSKDWIQQVVDATPGYESVVFERYSGRLYNFAQQNLPGYLARRIDADDVLQSVFRSFFRRNANKEFRFDESLDLWKLLSAITFRKICTAQTHHHAQRRDIFHDRDLLAGESRAAIRSDIPGPDQLCEICDMIDWVTTQLPPRYRLVIQMRLEGYRIHEIADATSISERSIKRVLSRVRELLAREY